MQRGRLLILLGLLLILGVGALALIFLFGPGGQAFLSGTPTPDVPPTPQVDIEMVVIAQQPLPRGHEITESDITLAPWSKQNKPGTAINDTTLVVGRLARYDIEPGEPILSTLIAENASTLSDTGSEAALRIPPGQVAITVPMTRLSGVGYALREGDHVNVLVSLLFTDVSEENQSVTPDQYLLLVKNVTESATGGAGQITFTTLDLGNAGVFLEENPLLPDAEILVHPSEPRRPRLVVQQIVQDAIVLKVGSFVEEDVVFSVASPTPLPEGSPPPPPTPVPPPDIVTLIVQPQDALVINYFLYAQSKFTLVLRSAGDASRVDTESVTLQYAVERFRISVPAPLNFALEPAVRQLISPTLPNEPAPIIIPLPDGRFLCGGGNCP